MAPRARHCGMFLAGIHGHNDLIRRTRMLERLNNHLSFNILKRDERFPPNVAIYRIQILPFHNILHKFQLDALFIQAKNLRNSSNHPIKSMIKAHAASIGMSLKKAVVNSPEKYAGPG
jgi:hypothetical protein